MSALCLRPVPPLQIFPPSTAGCPDMPDRRLRDSLDIPDCGCSLEPMPCRCWDARHGRPCDCPAVPAPCPHVLGIDPCRFSLSFDEWIELLHGDWSDEYAEAPLPAPSAMLPRGQRVKLMTARRKAGHALRHPADAWIDIAAIDRLCVIVCGLRGNGSAGDENVASDRRVD